MSKGLKVKKKYPWHKSDISGHIFHEKNVLSLY